VEWDAVIVNEKRNELIAWRSLRGSDIEHAGSVHFTDAPGGGTKVTVALQYNPPGGAVAAILASMWGQEPSQIIAKNLKRFQEIFDRGPSSYAEVATRARDEVDLASEASFPASDPPSYNH
jgi:uncharacterized membrane protein